MVHFTCDLCGKEMASSKDGRYVVKLEILPGFNPDEVRDEDLDDDPMEAISRSLQRDEEAPPEDPDEPRRETLRFDLCPGCRKKFLRDPLGRETLHQVHFSEN